MNIKDKTMNDYLVGVFVDNDGNEQRLMRSEALLLSQLKEYTESFEEFRQLLNTKGWVFVVMQMIELFSTPRNIDELWVWRRFAHVFGDNRTWEANRQLNYLFELGFQTATAYHDWKNLPWWRVLARFKARRTFHRRDLALVNYVCIARRFDSKWSDLESFCAYAGPRALDYRRGRPELSAN
jgi:hypothetical protein